MSGLFSPAHFPPAAGGAGGNFRNFHIFCGGVYVHVSPR